MHIRRATVADDEALRQLVCQVTTPGEVELVEEREPSFFSLHHAHGAEALTLVAENEQGTLQACGSTIVQRRLVRGVPTPVGYLCDLRVRPERRGTRFLLRAYQALVEAARCDLGAELHYTAVLDQNLAMRAAYDRPRGRRATLPPAWTACRYRMVSILPLPGRRRPGMRIRRAAERDVDELVALLARFEERREFGLLFDEELLRNRLAAWPGLALDHFRLAIDSQGRIAGCTAPWNTSGLRQTRVLGYRGAPARSRVAWNAGARLGGWPKLPPPGRCLDYTTLTHFAAATPAAADALLRTIRAESRQERWHFAALMVPDGSELEAVARRFPSLRTPARLYAVAHPEGAFAEARIETRDPSFEMALH